MTKGLLVIKSTGFAHYPLVSALARAQNSLVECQLLDIAGGARTVILHAVYTLVSQR